MPQARADLQEMFPNGDEQAFRILDDNFNYKGGMITPKNGHNATPQEMVALEYLAYLADEWDYSYDLATPSLTGEFK